MCINRGKVLKNKDWACRVRLILLVILFMFEGGPISAQVKDNVSAWLMRNNVKIYGRINQYDNQRYNLLTNQVKLPLEESSCKVSFIGSVWNITSKASSIQEKPDALDFEITFECLNGQLDQGSLSVDLDFSNWSEKNYVLLPAAAYNGNRFQWRRIPYSPKLCEARDIGVDKPVIISDVPKLSESGGFSRIQERSGSMSAPSIGFQSDTTQRGFWLLTEQGNSLGDYGLSIEETRKRDKAVISITSPIVREQYCYMICDAHYPSWDKPKDFKAGDKIIIRFRVYGFPAPEIQSLFDKFAVVRKDFSKGELLNNTLPYSACMQLLEEKFNKQNFVPKYGYYSVGMRENFLQDWQIGWTGGMISTYPLLFAGNAQTRQNVLRNFDWLFPNGISPSGFFWDAGKDGNIWYGGDIRKPYSKNWHLIRKSGDAVFYILKQFMLMEKMGIPVKKEWKEGLKRVCDSFVKLWNINHQFGQFVDSNTGEIAVGGSSSAAIVPAALCLASKYYNNADYLEVAQQAADFFYKNFVTRGITCGGPGDALQNCDSESSAAMVESYITLYEMTGSSKWLEIAQKAAHQFASWVVSYNYKFPGNSLFGHCGIHSTGAVFTNTQNKHAAPAMCTMSGVGLLKIFRATGDTFYIDLLRDIAHNMPQYLPHPDRPLGDFQYGHISERVNLTDWESVENIGEIFPMSTWAETSLMLTTTELPGIYVQPDKALVVAFDNIQYKILKNTKNKLVVALTNSTTVDAKVRIYHELSTSTRKNLGENCFYGLPEFALKSGESKTITFDKTK